MSWLMGVCSLVSFSLVLSKPLDSNLCCAPTKFESLLTFMGAQTEGAKPVPVMMEQRLSYDYDNKLMAITVYEKSKEIENLIYKYSENKYYVITPEGTCLHFPINNTLTPPCVPNDAMIMGNMFLGGGDEKLPVTAYYVQQAELNIYGTFSTQGCYPVTEGYIGETDSNPVVMSILYSNTTKGIANPDRFDVPASCTQGTESQIHKVTQHVLNKFTK